MNSRTRIPSRRSATASMTPPRDPAGHSHSSGGRSQTNDSSRRSDANGRGGSSDSEAKHKTPVDQITELRASYNAGKIYDSRSIPPPKEPADYQMQLMILEQQNKRRLMMNRHEQDTIGNGMPREEPAAGAESDQDPQESEQSENPQESEQPENPQQSHYTISEDAVGARSKLIAPYKGSETLRPTTSTKRVPGSSLVAAVKTPRPTVPSKSRVQKTRSSSPESPNALIVEVSDAENGTSSERNNPDLDFPSTSLIPDATPVGELSPILYNPRPEPEQRLDIRLAKTGDNPQEDQHGQLAPLSDNGLIQNLWQRIRELESENKRLRQHEEEDDPSLIKHRIFHCLADSDSDPYDDYDLDFDDGSTDDSRSTSGDDDNKIAYLAEPEWEIRDQDVTLRGRHPILNPEIYAEEHSFSFVIYKRYTMKHQRSEVDAAIRANKPLPAPVPVTQSVKLISEEMVDSFRALFDHYSSLRFDLPNLSKRPCLNAPFTWWYHCRKSKIPRLPKRQTELVMAIVNWIERNYSNLYESISEKFRRGVVCRTSMKYLIRPGDVLVLHTDGMPSGHIAISRPHSTPWTSADSQLGKSARGFCWVIKSRSYGYAGDFFWLESEELMEYEAKSAGDEVDIQSLPVIPLRYATNAVRERLFQRGKKFWELRRKRLISYEESLTKSNQTGQRFMIDFSTYQELHPDNKYSRTPRHGGGGATNLPMDGHELKDPEIYLFPATVPGFDLRLKKWIDLEVDYIQDVEWNKKAFSNLVADEDMKEMILALVTNQLDAEKGTDVIHNKGNGLVMLLHGSPGTGKTFTAESVAEIAKKPLYPVTCGDIGTEPEAVERYLEKVFYLGKVWDCVVLLDEAEVFLEQRTLQDLKRNALVSVFLRALEYYDGILILTTNRVGTFDEAFRSRIQLALRYEKLNIHQRKQIWRNFLARLKELGEEDKIDIDDIKLNLDELAKYPMNGRQIRNSITTARQLAKFMKKKMTFSHLKRAITVADKFDKYLADVQEGDVEECGGRGEDGRYSAEYFARSDGLR